jgi:hypothetical protein
VEVEIHDLGLWGSVLRRPKAGALRAREGYTIMITLMDSTRYAKRLADSLLTRLRREPVGKAAR